MFWFASGTKVSRLERELALSKEHIDQLEQSVALLSLNLSNLQSALLATSKTQDAVAYDVARIGELITALLEATDIDGFSGSGEPGSGTVH